MIADRVIRLVMDQKIRKFRMRILVECTCVFDHPYLNTGIQRVVRNVVNHLPDVQAIVECRPVALKNNRIYEVRRLIPERRECVLIDAQKRFERRRNAYWHLHHNINQALGPRSPHWLRRIINAFFRLGAFVFILPFVMVMLVFAPGRLHDRFQIRLGWLHNRYWQFHQQLERRSGIVRMPLLRGWFRSLFRIGSLGFLLCRKLTALLPRHDIAAERIRELQVQPGDVLVLLDSSWHADIFSHVERLRQQGLGVVAVIYDLIPLTHSKFCNDEHVDAFERWLEWVSRTADGFIAISETISNEVRADVIRRLGVEEAGKRWHQHFQLGSELDQVKGDAGIRAAVRTLFANGHSVYLMVSTIEPRKNHAYLLDAFERLWSAEPDARATLCIIGRIGWKCAPLIARIRSHPELGKRLFMFNDLGDSELEYCYRHSKSLVFPSFVEGFGLPLVEAMQRGLPAMASDIPVFREIGADFLAYFQLDDPGSLAALVSRFEASGEFPAQRPLADWSWPGWRESTQQLVERIAAHTAQRPA
ncbi:MAG: glycosyltransferase family 4 protein [Sterolibacterium sp.]|nr:glycosyltransferase family 4 protein [Sterolibacterium sp.]